ncbi:hypothetical protein H8E88_06005, partial [candidate division KSB1 bacterium]|nr:hypothetical protein [candidate division KSB1 bacterium]
METLKEKAVTAISSHPDAADIDDIMYRLYSITSQIFVFCAKEFLTQ